LSPIRPGAGRRRRFQTRAIPLVVIAVAAFAVGMIAGRTGVELSHAEHFASAWERGKGTEVVAKYYTTPAIFVLKGTVSQ
jgi:hypothetical protein